MIKETILLVDDDESVLSMLARSLEANYHILVASNGTAAVKVYEQHGPAIAALVTAVKMPRLDEDSRRMGSTYQSHAAHHPYEWEHGWRWNFTAPAATGNCFSGEAIYAHKRIGICFSVTIGRGATPSPPRVH